MAQTFFHASEDRFVIPGLDVNDSVGNQPGLSDRRREEVGARDAPQDLAPGAGCDTGAEKRSSGAVNRTVATTSHFMKRAQREAAVGESRV